MRANQDYWNILDRQMMEYIIKFLNFSDFMNIRRVNKRFYNISSSPSIQTFFGLNMECVLRSKLNAYQSKLRCLENTFSQDTDSIVCLNGGGFPYHVNNAAIAKFDISGFGSLFIFCIMSLVAKIQLSIKCFKTRKQISTIMLKLEEIDGSKLLLSEKTNSK